MELIDKAAVVAEIKRRINELKGNIFEFGNNESHECGAFHDICLYEDILSFLDTIEVKEMDLDALGVLAEHLIACDAHGISPIYKGRELDILEGLANNKAQKGE